ncbi:MAG: hypothetical protein VX466_00075 [Myxococcota bacterium]|nr:hypothetical protein [Myxococcota bacterium]
MWIRVNGVATLAASLLALATLPASAEPQESDPPPGNEQLWQLLRGDDESTWAPSLAVTSGVGFQRQKADVSSIDATSGLPLGLPGSGEGWRVAAYVGVNAEIMSPEMAGGIRLFANGEYLPTFSTDLDVAKVGDPQGIDIPPARFFPEPTCQPPFPPGQNEFSVQGCNCPFGFGCYPEEAITGIGSRTTESIGQNVFGAAVGVAIPFDFLDRKMLLKPSFGWIRYSIDVEGVVFKALKKPLTSPQIPVIRPVPIIRYVELRDTASQIFNAIGPGLEVEMEVHQAGPVETSLFLDAHGYRVLGNRKMKLSATTSASCPGPVLVQPPDGFDRQAELGFICGVQFGFQPTDYSADWSFKIDPWLYRVGLGQRFRWTGEK